MKLRFELSVLCCLTACAATTSTWGELPFLSFENAVESRGEGAWDTEVIPPAGGDVSADGPTYSVASSTLSYGSSADIEGLESGSNSYVDCCHGHECCGGCPDLLCGCVAPSDHCFDRFISPISNPLFFEDPRQLSELRFIYAHHIIPEDTPVLGSGDANYYAMQARVRLADRLSLIATKDGYIDMESNGTGDADGWADVAAGLKYTLLRDVQQRLLASGGRGVRDRSWVA
jgi:hypothetical protein